MNFAIGRSTSNRSEIGHRRKVHLPSYLLLIRDILQLLAPLAFHKYTKSIEFHQTQILIFKFIQHKFLNLNLDLD